MFFGTFFNPILFVSGPTHAVYFTDSRDVELGLILNLFVSVISQASE